MKTFFAQFRIMFKFYIWFIVLLFTMNDMFPEVLPGNWSYLAISIVALISLLMSVF